MFSRCTCLPWAQLAFHGHPPLQTWEPWTGIRHPAWMPSPARKEWGEAHEKSARMCQSIASLVVVNTLSVPERANWLISLPLEEEVWKGLCGGDELNITVPALCGCDRKWPELCCGVKSRAAGWAVVYHQRRTYPQLCRHLRCLPYRESTDLSTFKPPSFLM